MSQFVGYPVAMSNRAVLFQDHFWHGPEYAVGVPDLILSHPEFGIVVAEVKLERNWGKNTYRTVKLTDKQAIELYSIRASGGKVIILVGVASGPIHTYKDVKLSALSVFEFNVCMGEIKRNNLLIDHYEWGHNLGRWLKERMGGT